MRFSIAPNKHWHHRRHHCHSHYAHAVLALLYLLHIDPRSTDVEKVLLRNGLGRSILQGLSEVSRLNHTYYPKAAGSF